jgi:outer membrane receptor protein involved in Fe transport
VRFIGSIKECKQGDCNGGEPSRNVDAWYKLDLYGSYTVKSSAGKTTLSLGVNNLLDRNPPVIYIGNQGDSDGASYDLIGRFLYARLTHLF